ncbi:MULTISPECIES: Nramp family divalent metal transporter [unclassified Leeuwenhoekiella]|uniref:Nramp family divalent metal transporter n=1 Tax=unclassified Leeuwenhoekiella TaxID=2615029 RepID=UPI000C392C5C|nr:MULTISPECIES: Nramp family divalent metal transporter [unclassified Leeuwenhoekiella]MAW96523.1 iron transporter [Leeuwenhoekiella sp.]MBA81410.1 iron transporter [Leeuwenhoekiella sp.]|tara:strand:+ start:31102 stop:32313 length:1212 start_codon:yes stop_codon:yes gene_type:complete
MKNLLRQLGPGLLFAGAAIGVSHLVQSTRAGADYGLGLLWALLLIHLIKYPFFQFGPRYAAATGTSLLEGYLKLGKPLLILYFIINLLTMFTIQTAVTIVTAGIATYIFGMDWSITTWSLIVTACCAAILLVGNYSLLDRLMKVIVIVLTLSTLAAVVIAGFEPHQAVSFDQVIPSDALGIAFLIAFMGWMPAPLDISIWHSLWSLEKAKEGKISRKSAVFDFNVGFLGTVVVGTCFISLGALIMHNTGESFSPSGGAFAKQLIDMYTSSLGNWAFYIIGIAALTTMFSTTLTTLDASPRAMNKTFELLTGKTQSKGYATWMLVLISGTVCILFFLTSEMGKLVEVATILSFLTAPFFAIANYLAINSEDVAEEDRPSTALKIASWVGIILLIAFGIWYLSTL